MILKTKSVHNNDRCIWVIGKGTEPCNSDCNLSNAWRQKWSLSQQWRRCCRCLKADQNHVFLSSANIAAGTTFGLGHVMFGENRPSNCGLIPRSLNWSCLWRKCRKREAARIIFPRLSICSSLLARSVRVKVFRRSEMGRFQHTYTPNDLGNCKNQSYPGAQAHDGVPAAALSGEWNE